MDKIYSLLARDTWVALRARVAFEAANDVVHRDEFNRATDFGDTYNVVQNSMLVMVALAIARIFDLSDTERYLAEEQDKASVPVLAHLLMRQDVQERLILRARAWLPEPRYGAQLGANDCQAAMASALEIYDTFATSSEAQAAKTRVREFRTRRLAHHLFDKEPDALPQINDVFLLADTAREFVRYVGLALEGVSLHLDEQEKIKRRGDFKFWEVALSANLAAQRSDG